MGRPSKLTDQQWEKIGSRLLNGEKPASLAREYGVSKTALSLRFSKRTETVKEVANQIVATDVALSKLNVSEQIAALSLAHDLKSISQHMASTAKYGAMTAHRLAGIANAQVALVDDADPLSDKSLGILKGVAVLTKTSNEAAETPLNLLRANKEMIDNINREPPEPDQVGMRRPVLTREEWLRAHAVGV